MNDLETVALGDARPMVARWSPCAGDNRVARSGITPEINAISTLAVAVVSIALFLAWRLGAFRPVRASLAIEDAPAA